jgi:hypothetical protein
MQKQMTITLDESVYDGLFRVVGKNDVSRFIEDLLRPHVLDQVREAALEDGYRAMAADREREADALAWCSGIACDMADEAR